MSRGYFLRLAPGYVGFGREYGCLWPRINLGWAVLEILPSEFADRVEKLLGMLNHKTGASA